MARDPVEAYVWFNLATAAGDTNALAARDSLQKLLTAEQLAEGQRRATALATKTNPPAAK